MDDSKDADAKKLLADVSQNPDPGRNFGEVPIFTQFAVDNLVDAAYWITEDARIVYVNQTACKMLGYTREELMQMRMHEINPNASAEKWPVIWKLLKDGLNRTFEVEHKTKDGRLVPVEIAANFFEFEGVEYSCAFARDISERKQLELSLRQSEKMRAIGQLAGGVAHDFNNQLATIVGYADLLQSKKGDDAERKKYVEQIHLSARRAADLTNQLLAFSRQGKYRSEAIDLNELAKEVAEILEHSMEKNIQIVRRLSGEGTVVEGDPSQLQSALLNLALNARDAMKGGGRLRISTQRRILDEAICKEENLDVPAGAYVVLLVEDTGVGMNDETLSRIFEPFFTTKSKGEGTGLGMAAVYGSVRSHGGTVVVQSESGKGTKVQILLPAQDVQAKISPKKERLEKLPPLEAHVMVVEDEVSVLKVVTLLLQQLGCTVHAFESGAEAVKFFEISSNKVSLVLLDMRMPGMDGRETFHALRQIDPRVKVLLASGYSVEGDARDLLNDGAHGFLQKPYRKKHLAEELNRLLGLAKNDSGPAEAQARP